CDGDIYDPSAAKRVAPSSAWPCSSEPSRAGLTSFPFWTPQGGDMTSLCRPVLCLVFLLSAGCVSAEGEAAGHGGSATVVDGDTLEVNGQRVRIWGVDAPESAQICERDG